MPFAPTHPGSSSGPGWATSPTKTAGVMWTTGSHLNNAASLNAAHYGLAAPAKQYWLTAAQARAQLTGFDSYQQSLVRNAMKTAGIKYTGGAASSMWGKVVNYVQALSANGQYVDPFEVLGGIASGKMAYGGGGAGGAGGGTNISTSSSSSTSKSFQKTSKGSADRLLDDVLSNYLGRTATESEKANFLGALNKKEAATPVNVSTSSSSSRSVSSAAGSHSTSSSSNVSHSNTGIDPQEEAIQKAKGTKGYAEYQYGTTLMDAFLGALSAPASAAGTI